MTLHLPDEWQSHIDDITSSPGIVVVVGDVDVGKSTFCCLLANKGFEAGISTAVVDGDMGQSEIGPPTTIGLGLVVSPIQMLGDLDPKALFFVGSTSPVGHLLAAATGAKRLAEKAQALGRRMIIVDTTGFVRGAIARKLKTHKIELLRPRHIVALQKAGEAEHFLRFFDTWEDCTVHRLSPSPDVRPKSQLLRNQRRAVRFHEYFQSGEAHDLTLDKLATSGTWLHTGDPLAPKYLRFAERALDTTVYHGEVADRGVYLVTAGLRAASSGKGIAELQEYFHTKSVVVIPASRYLHLITGLTDSHLELLSLGIVRGIDFRSQTISVFTPLRSIAPVKSIRFGVLKLRSDGTEIGRLRPGEV